MTDLSERSAVTGPARAMHEIIVGASFQKAQEDIIGAVTRHMIRAMMSRFILERMPPFADLPFEAGGIVKGD